MISRSFIQELLDRADIYEVVGRRVQLQPKGDNGWACCPFHGEKTPSFSVSRGKQFYHCFGCGESGNALGFIMKYDGLDFVGAVEKLAQECGLEVRYDKSSRPAQSASPKLTELMDKAARWYVERLANWPQAQQYLTDRGLSQETISRFGIGWAPDDWHGLSNLFGAELQESLIEAGLQRRGNSGNVYDFFRNRIIFPIRNARGKTIAFSARTMTGEEPKYINTGSTPIFEKGKEVFGLFEARHAIAEKKRAIITEGQMDVIQLSQAGFAEACAPLGTAIRAEHIEKLLKITDQLIFSFDGDTAGRKAARRALELSLPLLGDAQKAVFLFLPEGQDPDSLVKEKGAAAFEEELSKAVPLSSFLIATLSQGRDLSVLEDKNAFLSEAAPLVRSTKSSLLRSGLVHQIAQVARLENDAQAASSLGVPYVSNAPAPRSKPYWQPRAERAAAPSVRGVPPQAQFQIRALLRNFVRFPHLALEFGRSAEEYFAHSDSVEQTCLLALLGLLQQEDDRGVTLADEIRQLPAENDSEFEQKTARLRNFLDALLSSEEVLAPALEQLRKSGFSGTSVASARLETRRILLAQELDALRVQRQALTRTTELTDQLRQEYSVLSARIKQLTTEISSIDRQLSENLLRGI